MTLQHIFSDILQLEVTENKLEKIQKGENSFLKCLCIAQPRRYVVSGYLTDNTHKVVSHIKFGNKWL
jgi:hypothetical protein